MLTPDAIERRDDFLTRYMTDAEMLAEYPDDDRRYAMAVSTWNQHAHKQSVESAITEARDNLRHGSYAVITRALKSTLLYCPRVFVTQTCFSPDEVVAFRKYYDASIPVALPDSIPAETVEVIALGRGTERECRELRPDIAVHFLPHPASLAGLNAQPEKVTKRLAEILKSSAATKELQSTPKGALQSTRGDSLSSLQVAIRKDYEPKQIVYAVVLDPYQFDAHGDWTPPRHVEDAAHKFMRESRVIGRGHSLPADAYVVESWIERYPSTVDYQKAIDGKEHRAFKLPFGNDTVHSGAWVLGIKLGDLEWAAYRDGEIDALSIGANGFRTPASEASMPKVEFVDLSGSS